LIAREAERRTFAIISHPYAGKTTLTESSVGDARPKALLSDGPRRLIAKFSSTTDTYPVVEGEFASGRPDRSRPPRALAT
jgi:serine/threonine-protein kinase HipA